MRVLITGGNGLVGKALCRGLQALNVNFIAPSKAQLDLANSKNTRIYFEQYKPDFIFHLAGLVGSLSDNIQHPAKFYLTNARIGINVIEAAIQSGCKNLLNLSSACVYPGDKDILSESDLMTGSLDVSRESYALSKLDTLLLCKYISEEYKVCYKSIIACNLYGPEDRIAEVHSHFMPSILRKIHQAKKNGYPSIEIWGDGEAKRELMYVDDLINFLLLVKGQIQELPDYINVGVGEDLSINEFYQIAAEILEYHGGFMHNLDKPSGIARRLLDSQKAKLLGWQQKTTLREGIAQTYNWLAGELNG